MPCTRIWLQMYAFCPRLRGRPAEKDAQPAPIGKAGLFPILTPGGCAALGGAVFALLGQDQQASGGAPKELAARGKAT